MAPRSTWKGSIGFGLVNVPVKLYGATEEKNISFNQIHSECNTKVQMPKWCPTCDRKVESDEIVKGYPIGKDEFVILENNELPELESTKNIEVIAFIDGDEIDPRYSLKSYFLAPEEAGLKAFALFLRAMESVNKVAVCKISMRDKERLATVKVFGQIMLLQTMWWTDELRDSGELLQKLPAVSDKEMELASQLISSMVSEDLYLGDYQDTYRDAVMQVIQAKVAGEEVPVTPVKAEKPTVDLVDALMASINVAETKQEERKTGGTLAEVMANAAKK